MDKVKLYFQETWHELLYKVTWPTWEELQTSTMVVLVSLIIFSIIVFLIDFFLGANPENTIFKGLLYYIYQIFS